MKNIKRAAAVFLSFAMLLPAAGCANKAEPVQPNIEIMDNSTDASADCDKTVELRTYTRNDDGEWVVTNEFIRSEDGRTLLKHKESVGYREYVYDCAGHQILMTGYADNGTDITERQENEYDAHGNRIRETFLKGSELKLCEEYVYTYDDRGQVLNYTHSDGVDTVRFENIRDDAGRITELMYSTASGEMARFSRTEYSTDGSFVTYYYTEPTAQASMPAASDIRPDTKSHGEPLAEGHYSSAGLCECERNYALSYEAEYRRDKNGNLKEKLETFDDGWLRTTYIRDDDGSELERIEENCNGSTTRYLSERAGKGKPIKFHYTAYHENVEGYADMMAEALDGTEFESYGDELSAAEIKELELNNTYIIYNYNNYTVQPDTRDSTNAQPYSRPYQQYNIPVGGSSGYSNVSPDIGWALTHSPGNGSLNPGPQPVTPGMGNNNSTWPYLNPAYQTLPPVIYIGPPRVSSSGNWIYP